MAKRDYRKGQLLYEFLAVPKPLMDTEEFINLPMACKVLAFNVAAQYSGKNNGRLTPSWEVMKQCGWKSKQTLSNAKRRLLECSFVMQTRIGHPPRTTEWWGFTWWKLNWCEGMEVRPEGWPYLNFLVARSVVQKPYQSSPKRAAGGTKTVPIAAPKGAPSVRNLDHATEVKAEKVIGTEIGEVIDIAISLGSSASQSSAQTALRPPATRTSGLDVQGGIGELLAPLQRRIAQRVGK